VTCALVLNHQDPVHFPLPRGGRLCMTREVVGRHRPDAVSADQPFQAFVVSNERGGWRLQVVGYDRPVFLDGRPVWEAELSDRRFIATGLLEFEIRIHAPWAGFAEFLDAVADDGGPFLAGRPLLQAYAEDHRHVLDVVVDATADEAIPSFLAEAANGLRSLLQGRAARDLLMEAPYLAPLAGATPLAKAFFEGGADKGWGIVLSADGHDRRDLLAQLRSNLWARINNDTLFFRFYDPKVARDWVYSLDEEGRSAFFGEAIREVLIPHDGQLFCLERSGRRRVASAALGHGLGGRAIDGIR
jgi:hypothetical protein